MLPTVYFTLWSSLVHDTVDRALYTKIRLCWLLVQVWGYNVSQGASGCCLPGYPRRIRDEFQPVDSSSRNLPKNLDAAYYSYTDQTIFFFKVCVGCYTNPPSAWGWLDGQSAVSLIHVLIVIIWLRQNTKLYIAQYKNNPAGSHAQPFFIFLLILHYILANTRPFIQHGNTISIRTETVRTYLHWQCQSHLMNLNFLFWLMSHGFYLA